MVIRYFISACLFLSLLAEGQSFYAIRRNREIQISAGTGVSSYYGDLANPGDYLDAKLNFLVGAEYTPYINFLENRLHARATLTWFQLGGSDSKANDAGRLARNLSFTSSNIQLTTVGVLDLFPQPAGMTGRPFFNVYGLTGIGALYINPQTIYNGSKIALQPLQTEGKKYSNFQFVIPYGIGARIKTGPLYNIAIEAIWHKTFTDYIDDVSIRFYPDPTTLKSQLSAELSDRRDEIDPFYETFQSGVRGNPDNNDAYMLLNVRFEYYLATRNSQRTNYNSIYKKRRKGVYNRPRGR